MKSCRNDNFGDTSFCHNENIRGYMWLQMCLHEIIGCQEDFIFMFQSLVLTPSCLSELAFVRDRMMLQWH